MPNIVTMLLSIVFLAVTPSWVFAAELKNNTGKQNQPEKERLVLMPMRVSEENKNMQSAMENALLQGLQQKYIVFEGEQVAQKAKEIFLKESRDLSKKECNETRCLQNIAEAFQSELIATSNVTKIEGGYLLSLNIQNIFDNKAVYSNTLPCRNCDGFQIIEKLKILDNEITTVQPTAADNTLPSTSISKSVSAENELWEYAQKENRIKSYQDYLAQFPRGKNASIAEGRINLLEEQATRDLTEQDQRSWTRATNIATEVSYQGYLKEFPHGQYYLQAQARIKKIQDLQHKTETETKPGNEFRDCPECPLMVVMPSGEFDMGSNKGEADEKPVHRVKIKKVFAMGKTEVTQGQWKALMSTIAVTQNTSENGIGELVGKIKHFLPNHKRRDVTESHFNSIMETSPESYQNCGDHCTEEQKRAIREAKEKDSSQASEIQTIEENNPSYFKNCGDECPVEQVSWADAQKYIQILNAKTGKKYRLPSEAEWEYACHSGGNTEYCGSDKLENISWYGANSQGGTAKSTHSVATLSSNSYGLYDMSGNVWEWVEDNYHPSYTGAPSDGSAWIGDSVKHVLRGGAWNSKSQDLRATARSRNEPIGRGAIGFRVVRVLP